MVRINLTLATIFIAALMAAAAFSSSLSAATEATVAVDYGKLPLVFEPNQGQTDERVKFLSRGRGYSLILTESEEWGPYRALVAPTVLAYFFFITLSTLRLSPFLARITGFNRLAVLLQVALSSVK